MKKIIALGSSICISLLLISSCQKEAENAVNNLTYQSTLDNNEAEAQFNEIRKIVDSELDTTNSNLRVQDGLCYSTTWDLENKTVEIVFDSSTCSDGRTRTGSLQVSYTGAYRTEGSVITTQLINYVVDGKAISGTKTITNKGKNSSDQTEFEVKVTKGVITYDDGTSSTWESTRTRTWVKGEETKGILGITDDEYSIFGSASGTNKDGVSYTAVVDQTTPLYYSVSCLISSRLPTSGTLTITPSGALDRVIDYGTGECDSKFTVTVGTVSKEFGL